MEHNHHAHRGAGAGAPSEHVVHDRHAGHHTEDFLRKFWIALVLTVPIFFYSEMARSLGIEAPVIPFSDYLALALGSVVFFYCGAVFLHSAYRELARRTPGMMTLIALAIVSAYAYSAGSILLGTGRDLLFELSSLIAVMLLGHWIEMRSVAGASGALRELATLLPDTAEILQDGATRSIPLAELREGDLVLVRPGAKVPADGEIVEGRSELNESILTGESKPVPKAAGAAVIAGSLNGDGSLTVRVTHIGADTFLSGVMRLVSEAQASKSRLELLSDTAAFYLTVIAIGTGGITFAAWLAVAGDIGMAIERLVAVLVIACPHALGLAVPLVASISTTMAARSGLLIRERRSLEAARTVDTVLFDKTGTLTHGSFSVVSASSDEALALAAAIEAHSEHSIGKAILAEARARGLAIGAAEDFERIPGVGARARVNGVRVFAGHRGGADIVVEADGKTVGTIALADTPRPEAKAAVEALAKMGITVAMITGDSEEAARETAAALGITEYFARVRPEEKVERVRMLQAQGARVAMVGDGVNDAPALAQADIGIAVGAGTNVAIESAGIILVRNDPRDVVKVITLSRLTYGKMLQNLFWATGYNVVAIPLAAGAFAAYGVVMQPALAAAFMSASTVIVAVNAVLLRRRTL